MFVCSLCGVCCMVIGASRVLGVVQYVARCVLFVVCWVLCVVCWVLFVACCLLFGFLGC